MAERRQILNPSHKYIPKKYWIISAANIFLRNPLAAAFHTSTVGSQFVLPKKLCRLFQGWAIHAFTVEKGIDLSCQKRDSAWQNVSPNNSWSKNCAPLWFVWWTIATQKWLLLGTLAITHKIWVPGAYFNISQTPTNISHTAETIFQVFAGKQQLGGVLSKQARWGEIVAD